MGCCDVFCILCECPQHSYITTSDDFEETINLKKILWFNKCTFLTKNNKVIHKCKEDSCNISFGHQMVIGILQV